MEVGQAATTRNSKSHLSSLSRLTRAPSCPQQVSQTRAPWGVKVDPNPNAEHGGAGHTGVRYAFLKSLAEG